MSLMDQQFDMLMIALRKIAHQGDNRVEVEIFDCIQRLPEAKKKSFQERLCTEAVAEEVKAPSDIEKLFWKGVAQFALSPSKPKI
jgi:hypothetical protein